MINQTKKNNLSVVNKTRGRKSVSQDGWGQIAFDGVKRQGGTMLEAVVTMVFISSPCFFNLHGF